jgi:exopolyphosphatase/guanosine-5'-triphosphate,3'-diphosphate pyrophosphatase
MTRVAAIDCGTNSIRLLVADVEPGGGPAGASRAGSGRQVSGQDAPSLTDLHREMEVVRLGHGVDRTGVIDPVAMERTLVAARRYAGTCRDLGAERVRFVATSASRDARNAAEFVAGVQRAFGDLDVTPEVVSGAEEAELSFAGATGDLLAAGIPGPYLVIDLGGGSTEFVRGTDHVEAGLSMDIGSVRMTERHLHGDPPSAAEVAAAVADIDAAIDAAEQSVPLTGLGTVVGLAGSITTVTGHVLGLTAYDSAAIHLARADRDAHIAAATDLLQRTTAQRAALGFMHPGRVDVIGAGALIWRQILARVGRRSPGAGVVVSEHDILDGIALSIAR